MQTIPIRQITTAQREQSTPGRFSIREVQQILKGKDLLHELHKHDFFFVLALQKGEGVHEIDFVPYAVHDHSIFILRPGQVHRLELKAHSTGYLMEFDHTFHQSQNTHHDQRWKKAAGKNYCQVEAANFNRLHTLLTHIFEEHTTRQEGYAEAIRAHLDLFFIEYIRQSQAPHSPARPENGYTQERFEELTQLLETHISTLKNVSDYADLLHLSPYQLNAITKASVGKTVSDLINEQITLEAKRYLLATSRQVKDIADLLGYEDVSYFIRFFRKHTGLSPDAFRRNFK